MLGFPLHHQYPELAQTHVHRVGDAIQPSHSLSSPSPPAFNLSQHQGLFQCISPSHQVAKVLELSASASVLPINSQDWFSLGLRVQVTQQSSPPPQFKNINSSALSFLYGPTLTSIHDSWINHSFDCMDLCRQSPLFNMLSRFVIAFLPRSMCLLISWLQSPSAMILEPNKINCGLYLSECGLRKIMEFKR